MWKKKETVVTLVLGSKRKILATFIGYRFSISEIEFGFMVEQS